MLVVDINFVNVTPVATVGSTIPDDNVIFCLGGFLFKISFFEDVENMLTKCLPMFFFGWE